LIQSTQLDSGARVILETVEHTEAASIGFWQTHGSRDETAAEAGYTHFLEHMVFKGTGRRSARQIAQEIERVGGYLNAFTEKEVTCFYCTLPGESIELAADVLADMYFGASLDAREIEKEKTVVLNEIGAAEDNPEEKAHQLYIEQLWGAHPLSRKITGEGADVRRMRRDGLQEFYCSRYGPGSLVVTASGRLDPARLLRTLEGLLGGPGRAPYRVQREPPSPRILCHAAPDKFEQVQVYTGTSFGSSRDIGDYYKDLVFNTLFGDSMSSRLFQRLREDRGLCYSVYSFRTYFTDVALWTIYASTAPDTAPELVAGIREELQRLHTDPPTAQEIDEAKSQLRGSMVLAREDMENRMKRLFRQMHLTGQAVEYETSFRLLQEVQRQDILGIVEERVRPAQFDLLAYGSRKLRKLARGGGAFS